MTKATKAASRGTVEDESLITVTTQQSRYYVDAIEPTTNEVVQQACATHTLLIQLTVSVDSGERSQHQCRKEGSAFTCKFALAARWPLRPHRQKWNWQIE